jgi:hypothetical protein
VKMNGEAGGENRQIKVDASQASQAEGDGKKVQFFHGQNIGAGESLSRPSSGPGSNDETRMTNDKGTVVAGVSPAGLTNAADTAASTAIGFRHSFVIRHSSFVIHTAPCSTFV